jgi:hypothetical protein
MPMMGCALAKRRQSGTAAHFRRHQRRSAALGGARYAIRGPDRFWGLPRPALGGGAVAAWKSGSQAAKGGLR